MMSIASVTSALQEMIATAVEAAGGGAIVRTAPPRRDPSGQPEVSLYFYRLQASSQSRNQAPAPRGAGGRAPAAARNAFDLHYLIAFAGESHLAETMIGNVLAEFEARPVLTGQPVQSEQIRVSPDYLPLEQTCRLWLAFGVPLRPSLLYVASPVMLDPAQSVQSRRVFRHR